MLKELDVSANLDGKSSRFTKTSGSAFAQELANGVSANGALAILDMSDNRIPDNQESNLKSICSSKSIDLKL